MLRGTFRAGALGQPRLQRAGGTVEFAGAIQQVGAVVDQRTSGGQQLAAGAGVGIAPVIVDEVVAREGSVLARGLLEVRDVRLDRAFMHQPGQYLGRTVAGVGSQALGLDAKPLRGAHDHGLGCRHLGLAYGGRGLHVHDDGVLEVDEVVVAVGVAGRTAGSGCPACGRIDRWSAPLGVSDRLFEVEDCGIRAKADSDSDARRTLIPTEAGR